MKLNFKKYLNYKYFLLSSQKIIIRAKIATAHQCKGSLRYAIEAVFYEAELTIKPKNMEIKVGDKVRLTENYKMSFGFPGEGVVIAIMDKCGLVALRECHTISWISLCDLIKVEEEKKAPKFKKGDKVRYNGYVYEIEDLVGKNRYTLKGLNFDLDEDMIDPHELYTEPSEEKKLDSITEGTSNKLSDMLEAYGNAMETIKTDSFWEQYIADLAKEIALKVANKFNAPQEAAEYAVSVAKAVAEGLKRK